MLNTRSHQLGTSLTSVSVRYSLIHGQARAYAPGEGSDLIGT